MAVEYIGKNAPDGMCFGYAATDKIAFFGTTPVVQQAGAAIATTLTTNIVLTTAIRAALVAYGLITDV